MCLKEFREGSRGLRQCKKVGPRLFGIDVHLCGGRLRGLEWPEASEDYFHSPWFAFMCGYAHPSLQQNIEGQTIASQFGEFQVPGQTIGSFQFPAATCQVSGGNKNFDAFAAAETPFYLP
jgi:hypothetical protein